MPQTDPIAEFYDAHPYPPSLPGLETSMNGWDLRASRVEHFRHWPTVPYRENHSILIAGCGTSQAARWAIRYPKARIVGIDVSPASLDAERLLIDKHGLENVELIEAQIEEVGFLAAEFDQIVCTGVLHHLADPLIGLQSLRGVLASRGALQLMLYGAYGRFGISMMREYCRRLGVEPVPGQLESLVRTLSELPLGHPMSHALRESPDFGDRDALADALLNPRERSYTVPEVFELLEAGGLRFGRWVRQAPYRPSCGIMGELPDRAKIEEMAESAQFASMELFRGTMTRHSLIAVRADSPLPNPAIDWRGESWRRFVPMTPITTMAVTDHVPEDKAVAVINRAHVDRDLVCFLNDSERVAFEGIDGKGPAGEIDGLTRELLQRLWLHDLVMIDASGA